MVNRITPLLLFIGFVWAQTDFDKLVLKDGTTYLGEYEKIEEEIVYFKPQDALAFQPVPVKLIQTLKLKDGTVLLHNGKIKKNKHTLGLGEYLLKGAAVTCIFTVVIVAVALATWPGIGGSSGDICFDPRCD